MSKRINSYDDLLKEKQQLEVLLQAQKQVIHYDIEEIKAQLQPAKDAIEFIKKITTKDRTSLLLSIGSDIAINSIVKNLLLSKAGWVTRLVIPFFLKNYSSHFLSEQKDIWLDKLKTWLNPKNGKEYQEDDSYAEKDDK